MTKLRLMSNNIWLCDENLTQWEMKGDDCSAICRYVGFARAYAEIEPDVIGLQECSATMASLLMEHFATEDVPCAGGGEFPHDDLSFKPNLQRTDGKNFITMLPRNVWKWQHSFLERRRSRLA